MDLTYYLCPSAGVCNVFKSQIFFLLKEISVYNYFFHWVFT